MQKAKFQTKHPEQGKINKPVSVEEYGLFKRAILQTLKKEALTHTELEARVNELLSKSFKGNVHWHVMVVKLDLEARNIIQRSKTSPAKYRLG